jgi:hypothetical protein
MFATKFISKIIRKIFANFLNHEVDLMINKEKENLTGALFDKLGNQLRINGHYHVNVYF